MFIPSKNESEKLNNKKGQAIAYGNIGLVYSNLKKYKTAIEFYNKALAIDSALNNYSGIARHLGNIAIVYSDQKELNRTHLNANR